MIIFLKQLLFLFKNRNFISSILGDYDKEFISYAITYYKKEVSQMGNLAQQTSGYDFDSRVNILSNLKTVIENMNVRNDYKLMKKGMTPAQILDHYKKEHLLLIISILYSTNPLFEIIDSSITTKGINLTLDTPLHPSRFIQMLDRVYSLATEYEIKYNTTKSYSRDRVFYNVEIITKKPYATLKDFIVQINDLMYDYISEMVKSDDYEFLKKFYDYNVKFYNLIPESSVLDSLEFGYKDEVKSILESNRVFILSVLSTNPV